MGGIILRSETALSSEMACHIVIAGEAHRVAQDTHSNN